MPNPKREQMKEKEKSERQGKVVALEAEKAALKVNYDQAIAALDSCIEQEQMILEALEKL